MRYWILIAGLVWGCKGEKDETDGDTSEPAGTTTGSTTGLTYGTTGVVTGGGTTTGTGTGGGFTTYRDGTYYGTLDMTIDYVPMEGTAYYGYCQGSVTLNVNGANTPSIQGLADCDATAAGLGVLDFQIIGDSPGDPYAGGDAELMGTGRAAAWSGIFATDSLTGSFASGGPAFDGSFDYSGVFTAVR